MRKWRYEAADPGVLGELNLLLQPGDVFDAPDEWEPYPNPHPVYKPADKKPAPAPAPEE